MKIQMIAQISGTRDGVNWPEAGGIIDVPKDEAAQLIGARLAREPEREPEKAVSRKPETAVKKGLTKASTDGDR